MNYESELQFLKKVLEQYHINVHEVPQSSNDYILLDKGIRKHLGLENTFKTIADLIHFPIEFNKIYNISDDFFLHYFMLTLPADIEPIYLVIGPYTEHHITQNEMMTVIEKTKLPLHFMDSLTHYYVSIPFLTDTNSLRILLSCFWESIWKSDQNCILEEMDLRLCTKQSQLLPTALFENDSETNNIAFQMQLIEERYQIEGKLITYISQGNHNKASAILTGLNNFMSGTGSNNRLLDYKNYSIVLNTLLRKGAEAGSVHPFHIDKLSSYFKKKIETITSFKQCENLYTEMIRKYCLLVKNHSLKDYSLLIQKVIARIDVDLTADHSLKIYANLLSVHPSYLSSLFHKETGLTLTEYVNQKRVEHGVFLLNTTDMQIQMIAQQCGIPDINYFTRIFKKQYGITPSEYRKSLYK